MKKDPILSRQILTYMVSLTFIIIAIAILGSYLFYSFLIYYLPGGALTGNEDEMTLVDWLWIMIASLTSLVVSLFFTVKLSSQGNLDARATCTSSQLGEMNNLVNDFNEMAEKLQTLDIQRNLWNSAIAHELRTPVTILRGRLQGLVDGVFEPAPVLFQNLLKQTEGLAHLIEDLRVVSSYGGAGYTLTLSETDLEVTITSVLDNFLPEFQREDFTIATELEHQRCFCDPMRIMQCLTVLFDNALKYSSSRSLRVKNGIVGKENVILVEDSGPGIPEELHSLLFQPFQRGEYARKSHPQGCGLGLSVVRAIMLAHGGNATYTLTPENHSIFTLSWPVSQDQK